MYNSTTPTQILLSPKKIFHGPFILITIILVSLATFSSYAGERTMLNLDKKLRYSGSLVNKTPYGVGKLSIGGDDGSQLEINGTFKWNKILNGSYCNRITGDWGVKNMKDIFNFDSLSYTVDKKNHILSMKIYGIKLGKSGLISNPPAIEIKYIYEKKNKRWSIMNMPNQVTVTATGLDAHLGSYTYSYQTQFTKAKGYYDRGYFEPIDIETFSIEDITQPIIISYSNGAEVHFDGKKFTSKWGNSKVIGEYRKGEQRYDERRLSGVNLYLNNSTINSSNLTNNGWSETWEGEIIFSDGSKFIGKISNDKLKPSQFGLNLLSPNIHISESDFCYGDLYTPDNYRIEYHQWGGVDKDDLLSSKIKAYKVKSPGESEAPYITHRVANNNIKEDSRTTLRDFVNRGSDKYKGYGQVELNYLFSDEYCYHEPFSFKYNESTGILKFTGHAQKIYPSSNSKDFYFAIDDHLCLSYPKSRVSLHHGKNYFDEPRSVPTMETIKISNETYKKMVNKKCGLAWVFKIDKFSHFELFGKTTRLYIINEETYEIIADISDSLNTSNTSFKSESQEVYKKKTYHKEGRIENCGMCLGTGNGLQGGYCPFCGGKGWYIEHEW
ncbi:MAG: hypothetical protein K2K82_05360 [Muribaculaceae bacterium]|nr:hypothetical protein [Muribaculaceae bacterium]